MAKWLEVRGKGEQRGKVADNRVRRAAQRQGLLLRRSRRRDPNAPDYGSYWLVDENNCLVYGGRWGASLAEVEEWLRTPGSAELQT